MEADYIAHLVHGLLMASGNVIPLTITFRASASSLSLKLSKAKFRMLWKGSLTRTQSFAMFWKPNMNASRTASSSAAGQKLGKHPG